jgi:hypothetical protein
MHERHIIHIEAPPRDVWAVLMDVERWPDWTPTMRRVERLDAGPFGPGSRARITLRGLPPGAWRVTQLDDGRSFTWETETGVRALAGHVIEPDGAGTKLTLTASTRGLFALLLTPVTMLLTRGHVRREAEGLKRYCEQRAAAPLA